MKNQQYPVIVGHELINSAAANDVHCVCVCLNLRIEATISFSDNKQLWLRKTTDLFVAAQQIEIPFDCTFHLRQFRFGNRLC